MRSRKMLNVIMVVLAVGLLAYLGFRVRIASAADAVVVLKTSGMTCGSCSDRIAALLQEVKGVAATEVDVEGGWVVVGYDTKSVKPEVLAEKVNVAGFASGIHRILTPEQFKQLTGREIGKKAAANSGCCGGKGGCGAGKQS